MSPRRPATPWPTYAPQRRVLAIAHNVTAATRLFDAIALMATDSRIDIVFTDPQSSAFPDGTAEFLKTRGVRQISWPAATEQNFDLAIAASHGHADRDLNIPLVVIPHGMGYNKYLETGNRKPETGNRKPETGNRKPVFGLSNEWLLHDGQVVPTVLTLSHDEQLARLERDCPAALPAAVVTGDLAFDQLHASRPWRSSYRRALGVSTTETLVLVSSTWGLDSLLGSVTELPRLLGEQLPADEFRVAVALHPNVWWGHSPWQVRQWLSACTRAGVTVLAEADDWRSALVAADVVVGDHGSVTFYAAALGKPVLLATAPVNAVAPDSPIGMFLSRAPHLNLREDLPAQLRNVVASHNPAELADVTSLTTSVPGGAAAALRAVLYNVLNLAEPEEPADVASLPVPQRPLRRTDSHLVTVSWAGSRAARVTRYPAERLRSDIPLPQGTHLAVGTGEPWRRWLQLTDILVGLPGDGNRDWVADTLAGAPGAVLATAPAQDQGWILGDRQGVLVRITEAGDLFASVALQALTDGGRLADLAGTWWITAGPRTLEIEVNQIP